MAKRRRQRGGHAETGRLRLAAPRASARGRRPAPLLAPPRSTGLWKDALPDAQLTMRRGSGPCAAPRRPRGTTLSCSTLAATTELMSELISRNRLEPAELRQRHLHLHRRPRRRLPRGRRARPGIGSRSTALQPRDGRPWSDGAGDPGARPLLRGRRTRSPPTSTSARLASLSEPTSIPHIFIGRVSVHFSKKLDEIPGYTAGVPAGKAPEAIAAEDIAQLASNESPYPPHPDVVKAIAAAADGDEIPLPGSVRRAAAPADRRSAMTPTPPRSRSRTAPARSPPLAAGSPSASPVPRSSSPGRRSRSTRFSRRSGARPRSGCR